MKKPALLLWIVTAPWLHAQQAPGIPNWLTPYPGGETKDRQTAVLAESVYTAAAQPREVVDHYRKLFAAAHLRFEPAPMGYGFTIHGTPAECDLTIRIRNLNGTSEVRVTCALSHSGVDVAAKRDENERKGVATMQKYDQPVYPKPKPPQAPLAWPAWLVHLEGARLAIQAGPDLGSVRSASSSFTTRHDRATILAYYRDLLNANGYNVIAQSPANIPALARGWVEGAAYPDGRSGRREVVRVEVRIAGSASVVDLKVRSIPAVSQ